MRAVIDSKPGKFFKCLLENGDIITLHESCFPKEIEVGNVVKISFEIDSEASEKQSELMK